MKRRAALPGMAEVESKQPNKTTYSTHVALAQGMMV